MNSDITALCFLPPNTLHQDKNSLSKVPSGMQSGGEEEPEDEPHLPLPPRMEIIKNPPAPDDKVT